MTSEEIAHIVRGKTPRLQAKHSLCYWQPQYWNKTYLKQRFIFFNNYLYQENFFAEKVWYIFRIFDKFKLNFWKLVRNDPEVNISRTRIYSEQHNLDYHTDFARFSDILYNSLHQVFRGYQSNGTLLEVRSSLPHKSSQYQESFRRFQVVSPTQNYKSLVSVRGDTNKLVHNQPLQRSNKYHQKLLSASSHPLHPPVIPTPTITISHRTPVGYKLKVKIVPFTLL